MQPPQMYGGQQQYGQQPQPMGYTPGVFCATAQSYES